MEIILKKTLLENLVKKQTRKLTRKLTKPGVHLALPFLILFCSVCGIAHAANTQNSAAKSSEKSSEETTTSRSSGEVTEEQEVVLKKQEPSWTLRLGYFVWQERVKLSQGAQSDEALGNFFGNSLSLAYEHYFTPHHGIAAEIFLLSGTAAAGGTQTSLAYAPGVLTNFSGEGASIRYAYAFSDSISASVGPLLLAHSINWPMDSTGTNAKSESNSVLGMVLDLRYRLTQSWEVRQMVGSLSPDLGILWTLSIGYHF